MTNFTVGSRVRLKSDWGVCTECPDPRPVLSAGLRGVVTHISFWDLAMWPITAEFDGEEYLFADDELEADTEGDAAT